MCVVVALRHVFYVIKDEKGQMTILDQGGLISIYPNIEAKLKKHQIDYVEIPWTNETDPTNIISAIDFKTQGEIKVPTKIFDKFIVCHNLINFVHDKTEELQKQGKSLSDIMEHFKMMAKNQEGNRPLSENGDIFSSLKKETKEMKKGFLTCCFGDKNDVLR